ncbi:hypothetical protein E2C01_020013 [Portunus trituberculatus]|uniref:Uncharacterized protein n=1 Tax=Portunus trituberculatus TaxID=210409 RepID=A0A5B7DYR9_PORTR|nr:hypothetical protein [Portunus trituberculatus]
MSFSGPTATRAPMVKSQWLCCPGQAAKAHLVPVKREASLGCTSLNPQRPAGLPHYPSNSSQPNTGLPLTGLHSGSHSREPQRGPGRQSGRLPLFLHPDCVCSWLDPVS